MLRKVFFCSLLLFFAVATGAQAAVLRSSGGDVKVDMMIGSGLQQAPETMNVRPGYLVSVGENSSATIIFANGCSVAIGSGQYMVVPGRSIECPGSRRAAGNSLAIPAGVAATVGVIAVIGSQNKGKSASP